MMRLSRSFGFLTPVDGAADVFCHVSVVEDAGYATLPKGASVTCEVAEDRRGPAVCPILAVDTSTAPAPRAGRDEPRHGSRERGLGHDEPAGPAEERRGFVKFYDAARGYGFVVPDGGGRDVFVHGNVLGRAGLGALEPAQRVCVMVAPGARGPQAMAIELL